MNPNPVTGGDRDPVYFWDFFDVTGEAEVDLSDTLVVLGKFGVNPGDPGYDPLDDRDATDGAKPWRSSFAGDGIDLTDALVNLQQFGHTCSAPP